MTTPALQLVYCGPYNARITVRSCAARWLASRVEALWLDIGRADTADCRDCGEGQRSVEQLGDDLPPPAKPNLCRCGCGVVAPDGLRFAADECKRRFYSLLRNRRRP